MPDNIDSSTSQAFSFFALPVRADGLVVRESGELPQPTANQAALIPRPQPPTPTETPFTERVRQAEEQREARRLCGRLRASDRCPGECVTDQLARGVPLRELRGLDAFRDIQNGGLG